MDFEFYFTCPICKEIVEHKHAGTTYIRYEKNEAVKVFGELIYDHFASEHTETIIEKNIPHSDY
jgi:hypothetical protein